jgi:fatty-acyl-CoA synthase
MNATQAWRRALKYTAKAGDVSLPALLPMLADRFGENPLFIEADDRRVTYREFHIRVQQYGRLALDLGLQKNDVVGLSMANSADYVAIWLGLARIGCSVALLNTNLLPDALAHCLRVAGARYVVSDTLLYGRTPSDVVVPTMTTVSGKPIAVFRIDNSHTLRNDDRDTRGRAPIGLPAPSGNDRALLIFTSGTTGLPKAVNITHRRITEWSYWFAGMMNLQPSDRLFNCLPMYHSVGGVVGIGSMLVSGGSIVVRRRFSAKKFWPDVASTRCTIFLYIGELCRYLVSSGPAHETSDHTLRLACGNGLHADVWSQFQTLSKIPEIFEFYAATEGNLSLYNCDGHVGSIGYIPAFLRRHFMVEVIRCEADGTPIRNELGLCERCDPDEAGEAIRLLRTRRFDGYTDVAASERKYLRDAFEVGDVWFRSGDLMRRDSAGYYYFVDRIGDTYRWKGENVSTTEVADTLRGFDGIDDVAVYGVAVPGSDGRAGMAAVVTNHRFDWTSFARFVERTLPEYARPMFVRECKTLSYTGTFKLIKADLLREGFEGTTDPVWRRDRHRKYQPLARVGGDPRLSWEPLDFHRGKFACVGAAVQSVRALHD